MRDLSVKIFRSALAGTAILLISAAEPGIVAYTGSDARAEANAGELSCLVCLWESSPSMHAFAGETEGVCNTPAEREENNCRSCGGESSCHENPLSGPCHVECQISENVPDLADAVARRDGVAIAALMKQHEDRVAYNEERGAIQVLGCGNRIIAHWELPAEAVLPYLN